MGGGRRDLLLRGRRARRGAETGGLRSHEGAGRAAPGDRSEDRPSRDHHRCAEGAGHGIDTDLDLEHLGGIAAGPTPADDLHGRFPSMIGETTIATFRAMGTEVVLIGPDSVDAAPARRAVRVVRRVFEREERRFSRFRSDSELSLVNATAGRTVELSTGFAALLRRALDGARRTKGRFDPTVLPALIAAGYDRDFDELFAGARNALHPPVPCGRWRHVHLDGHRLRMPEGIALDFGGIAKGWTVDLAVRAALRAGLPWALVNAGGDLRIEGVAPPVAVAVEDPGDPTSESARLHLSSGALATSSTMARAWGDGLHHLIDPRTGKPIDGDVVQATIWAPSCAEAEVLAKAAIVGGLTSIGDVPAAVVTRDGSLVLRMNPTEVVAA
jgi:thiamine biosynthesis lipoprotein